jgi:hypothetical protein
MYYYYVQFPRIPGFHPTPGHATPPLDKHRHSSETLIINSSKTLTDMMFWQPPNLSFSSVFQATFVKQPINPVLIPTGGATPMRFLLISDTALGSTATAATSIARFISALQRTIQSERITHVVHLGNLVRGDARSPMELFETLLGALEGLSIPIWLIGSNSDRELFGRVSGGNRRGKVTMVQELAIVMELPAGNRVFLTYDLGNDIGVTDQFAWSFVTWLKENARSAIGDEDWLLVGQCKTQFLSADGRIGCVGVFAPDPPIWSCAVLSIGGGVEIEIKSDISFILES